MANRNEQGNSLVRLPLYAAEAQRTTNPASSTWRSAQDQTLVNCYPVVAKDPLQDNKARVFIQSRMGWNDADASTSLSMLTDPTNTRIVASMGMAGLDDTMINVYTNGTTVWVVAYRLITGSATLVGSFTASTYNITAGSAYYHLSETAIGAGNTPGFALVVSEISGTDSQVWFATSSAGTFGATLTRITDASFPTIVGKKVVGPVVQLNENFYVLTSDGIIYNSELDGSGYAQLVNWDSSGFVSANSYPDAGIGLIRYKHHLVAMGHQTIEFFNDEGIAAPASPIAPTQQAFIKSGASGQKAYINIDDTVWWISSSHSGHKGLWKLEGYTPVLVSAPPMSVNMQQDPGMYADLQIVSMHGLRHIITNIPTRAGPWFDDGVLQGDTVAVSGSNEVLAGVWVYCIENNTWWIWAPEHDYTSGGASFAERLITTTFPTSAFGQIRVCYGVAWSAGVFSYALHPRIAFYYAEKYANNPSAAKNWTFDSYNLNDSGTVDSYRIPMMISTNWYDFGSDKRKFLRSVRIIGDHIKNMNGGNAPWTAFNAEGLTLTLGYSRTDGITDSTDPEIIRSKALITYNEHRYNFNNFGAFRKARFWVLINTYVPVRLEALELTLAQGTH